MPNPDAGTERANPTTATTAPPASDRIPGPWSRIPRWTPDVVVAVAATLYTLPLLPEHAESGPRRFNASAITLHSALGVVAISAASTAVVVAATTLILDRIDTRT